MSFNVNDQYYNVGFSSKRYVVFSNSICSRTTHTFTPIVSGAIHTVLLWGPGGSNTVNTSVSVGGAGGFSMWQGPISTSKTIVTPTGGSGLATTFDGSTCTAGAGGNGAFQGSVALNPGGTGGIGNMCNGQQGATCPNRGSVDSLIYYGAGGAGGGNPARCSRAKVWLLFCGDGDII